ncbi:MAG: hypothetical protein M1839_005974 [Geoglossum umbratile]|nr:MAG: hypothetical protein M1839_005974 [Geoglossum umbratile]
MRLDTSANRQESLHASSPESSRFSKISIRVGRHIKQHPWTEFQLAQGEYDEVEHRLKQDESLLGYVKDKIRYDYDGGSHRLVARTPTGVQELSIGGVEDGIHCQLKTIRGGSDKAALSAQKVCAARSTEIYFPVDDAPPTTKPKHEPDASFWHADAKYPGVIIEISYSRKSKSVSRPAERYHSDSDASMRVVVGLDIEYGKKGSRKAKLVVQEIADEAFRDDQGNPTDHPGLRLQLSDFAYEELTEDVVRGRDQEILLSTQQLCQYLAAAEDMARRQRVRVKHSILPEVKKRKRSEPPPQRGWLLVMKRSKLSKSREQPSVWRMMTQTTSTY